MKDDFNRHKTDTEPVLTDLGTDVAGILLAVKKMETQQTMQETSIVNLQEMSLTMQAPDGTEKEAKKPVSTDQLKRLLALIENNAQANALQRETTMNVLLRLELLEKNTANVPTKGSIPELPNVYARQPGDAPLRGSSRRMGNLMAPELAISTHSELMDRRVQLQMATPDQSRRAGFLPNPNASIDSTGPPPPKLAMYDPTAVKRKVGGQYKGRQPGHSVDAGTFEPVVVYAATQGHTPQHRRVSQGIVGGTNSMQLSNRP